MQNNSPKLHYESHFAHLGAERLHLRRIYANPDGIPVFLVHGFIENGKIFYTESGKGYAPFLAQHGYDVFVADLRGRGQSIPPIGPDSDFGQEEFMNEEMPAFLEKIIELKGPRPMHWGAHSWGGVMLLAYLARHTPPVDILSIVTFGSKRRISVRNFAWLWQIAFFWNLVFPGLIRQKGFLDLSRLRPASDNESKRVFEETQHWVRTKDWQHWRTDFDFRAALQAKNLPPTLYFAGQKDAVLGHPKDVRILMEETGADNAKFQLLSRKNGHQRDYGHIDMLIAKEAPTDHFPMALDWMQQAEINRVHIVNDTKSA